MDVSVAQLGICEHKGCGEVFSIREMTPYQAVGTRCPSCKKTITWKSLGMECVGAGGIYNKVCWVGSKGKWVKQKPENSFFIKGWWVVPGISLSKKGYTIPPGKVVHHRVWCQRWCIKEKNGNLSETAHSLHKTKDRAYAFVSQMSFNGFIPKSEPYECLIDPDRFKSVQAFDVEGGYIHYCSMSPAPYKRKYTESKIVEMTVAL